MQAVLHNHSPIKSLVLKGQALSADYSCGFTETFSDGPNPIILANGLPLICHGLSANGSFRNLVRVQPLLPGSWWMNYCPLCYKEEMIITRIVVIFKKKDLQGKWRRIFAPTSRPALRQRDILCRDIK